MTSLEIFAKANEQGGSLAIQSWTDGGLIDVNARLPRQFSPPPALVFAAKCEQKAIVDVLLRANARIDEFDSNRQTRSSAQSRAQEFTWMHAT
jgi:hypothetical protein